MADQWEHKEGGYGNTVTVYEIKRGKNVYIRAWDKEHGKVVERSLGYPVRDEEGEWIEGNKERAVSAAKEASKRKHEGRGPVPRRLTLGHLYEEFERDEMPNLSETRRKVVKRHLRAIIHGWDRLGPGYPVLQFDGSDWKAWIRQRTRGEIDCHGDPVPDPDQREGVKGSTVAFELASFRQMCRWGAKQRTEDGFLLRFNPTKGLEAPKNKRPTARPVASDRKYRDLLDSSRDVTMSNGNGRRGTLVRSYLYELLVLCGECGPRISEVCRLKRRDLLLDPDRVREVLHLDDPSREAPHGAIRWRAQHEANNKGQVRVVMINRLVRETLDQHLDRLLAEGDGVPGPDSWVFPAPKSDGHLREDVAREWWLEAEEEAGYEHPDQGGFHELRRRWASKRKHLPAADVAKVGGWSDEKTMKESYQHADPETMRRVVLNPGAPILGEL